MSLHLQAYTPYTITDIEALCERIGSGRQQGFSIVDEELERGLRALAIPIVDRTGQTVGAINLSTHSTRITRNEMRDTFLPAVRKVAEKVSQSI